MRADIRQYLVVTGNYWAFTLTDGALRMLIVLHFYQLGYTPLAIASLFLFYEFFGIVTNLVGGWLGARLGLNKTMNIGLFLQIVALSMLLGFQSPDLSGTGRAVAAAQTAPALVAGESRDYAEGAREDRHRDLPAKKARLIALKVKTTRAPGHIRDAASRLSSSRRGHAGPQPDPRMPDASGTLHRLEVAGGKVQREEKLLQGNGERIRDVRQGPDGLLYMVTDSPQGRLLRLQPN